MPQQAPAGSLTGTVRDSAAGTPLAGATVRVSRNGVRMAAAAQGDTIGVPTLPERDNYYEADVVHKFDGGIVAKLVAYYRDNSPAVDDNTLPGTALVATVNVARVHVTGIETVLEFHPDGPFSGYINAALNHATAHGPVTGGFFPTPYPTGWFDQDHDQRLSIVASGNYSPRWGYMNLTGIVGSGLRTGIRPRRRTRRGSSISTRASRSRRVS